LQCEKGMTDPGKDGHASLKETPQKEQGAIAMVNRKFAAGEWCEQKGKVGPEKRRDKKSQI